MNELRARVLTGTILIALGLFIYIYCAPLVLSTILYTILGLILVYEWPRLAAAHKGLWLLMPLYPVGPFILLSYINETHHSILLPLFILTCTFDSAAYFFGKRFGKHKLLPRISPGKSWQGLAGGILITIAIAAALHAFNGGHSWVPLALFTIGLCVTATIGDLFESWLKRKARLKDTSAILPGHGGLLDRFDSIMASAVYFIVFKKWALALFC